MAGPDPLRAVPRGLEKPMPIMFLTPIEWGVAIIGLGLGIAIRQFLFGAVIAFGFVYLYRKTTSTGKRGLYVHMIWRAGLPFDPLMKKFWPKPSAVDLNE